MARRYHIDELLVLRASPLVTKPDKLPPIEEWMGPIPDPATQRKTANARDNNQNEITSNRRPSLFETRHVSRGSNSEDIILGPPKTAFASASRIYGKTSSLDSTDRSKSKDSDDVKNDRYNFREKFFKDRENGERDVDRKDTRLGATNGRRGGRDEREEWNNGRPRRTFGQDDQERRPRRNGENERWENRDKDRDQQDFGFERGNRDKDGRFISRRDGQGRGRHEQSWFRDDAGQDAQNVDEERPSARNRDWRRDRHGADRDWNRGAKFEQDPEWMDSTDRDEPQQAHTQEDFQRWKERMKAGSTQQTQQQPEEKKETPEQVPEGSRKTESRPTEGELFSNISTPFQDTGLERFFGLLGDNKASQDPGTPGPTESASKRDSLPKGGKSSRFAGLFSPPVENTYKELETLNRPDRPQSTDADQEGFQRILQMLGSSKSRNATPQIDASQQPCPAVPPQAEVTRVSTTLISPVSESINRPDYVGYQDPNARNRNSAGLDSLLSQGSPKDSQATIRDRENLLRLMQQVRISPASSQPQAPLQSPVTAGPTPGILHVPDLLSRPQGMQKPQRTPSFLDDPAIADMSRPGADPNEQLRRRPPQMGYFDEIPFPGVPQGGQAAGAPGGRIPQNPGQPPMVLQRPPGFEQMPLPGWGNQLPQSPLAPPPGIPTPSRGMNPNFISGPMPMPGNMPPLHDRQPLPRGPPPGMMPPPGYMNINGPAPSAFPPMPHTPDAMMGLPHAGQGPVGPGNVGPHGPPPTSRHLLEMFGQTNGADVRAMMGPGHFR